MLTGSSRLDGLRVFRCLGCVRWLLFPCTVHSCVTLRARGDHLKGDRSGKEERFGSNVVTRCRVGGQEGIIENIDRVLKECRLECSEDTVVDFVNQFKPTDKEEDVVRIIAFLLTRDI